MKFLFFISIVVTFIFISCSKGAGGAGDENGGGIHGPIDYDTIAPVVTISSPATNQTVASATSFTITGTVTDDYGLYQGFVAVTADASGVEMKKQQYEIHGFKGYNFSVPFTTPVVTAVTDYTITVLFEDHGNNKTIKILKIKITP